MELRLYTHDEVKQEALDNGVHPEVFALLDGLTDDERLSVFHAYCLRCGRPETGCRCCDAMKDAGMQVCAMSDKEQMTEEADWEKIHPWFGPCDGNAPGGGCAACSDVESGNSVVNPWRLMWENNRRRLSEPKNGKKR